MLQSKWLVVGLVALNVGLGAALYLRSGGSGSQAYAQARARANYITATGHSQNKSVLYIFETYSGKLAVSAIDIDGKQITPLVGADVASDMARMRR